MRLSQHVGKNTTPTPRPTASLAASVPGAVGKKRVHNKEDWAAGAGFGHGASFYDEDRYRYMCCYSGLYLSTVKVAAR